MAKMVDLHIHPSLQLYYLPFLRKNLGSFAPSLPMRNPVSFRSSQRNLSKSPEKVLMCAHYVIERDFIANGITPLGRALIKKLVPDIYNYLTRNDSWQVLNEMMDTLEIAAEKANAKADGKLKRFRFARKFSDLANIADDEIVLIHTLEGAHSLGYSPSAGQTLAAYWQDVEKRIDTLKTRGVAMITICHFWDNMFFPQTDGTEIRPKKVGGKIVVAKDDLLAHMKRATWTYPAPGKFGEQISKKLFDAGIIIDIAHMQEHARSQVLEMALKSKRPIIASHMGLKHFVDHEYNITDEEIIKMRDVGGIIGLIPTHRWLVHPSEYKQKAGKGVAVMIEHMLHIKKVAGGVETIGIGSDFDGMTDPFKDIYLPKHLDALYKEMLKHFTRKEADMIMYDNAMRVLEAGWR